MQLTEAQKLAAAYQHFTLEEWKFLAALIVRAVQDRPGQKTDKIRTLLTKFPSAVL